MLGGIEGTSCSSKRSLSVTSPLICIPPRGACLSPAMAGVVSAQEFTALQEQLMKLKEEKYEGLEREKKQKKEIERLTKVNADMEAQAKKNAGT